MAVKGQGALNPWVWRVKHLHEFLASFVPPNQAPPASSVLAMRTATPTGHNTAREVYSFSPASAPPRQPGQALSQAAPQVSGGQRPGNDETAASRDEVVSPEPSHLPAGKLLPAEVELLRASRVCPASSVAGVMVCVCWSGQLTHHLLASLVQGCCTSLARCPCSSTAPPNRTPSTMAAWRAPSLRLWKPMRQANGRLCSSAAFLNLKPFLYMGLPATQLRRVQN